MTAMTYTITLLDGDTVIEQYTVDRTGTTTDQLSRDLRATALHTDIPDKYPAFRYTVVAA